MSDNRALARTAASQYGLLTIAQHRAAGLSQKTVQSRRASGRYDRMGRGVDAIAGTPASWHQRVMAAWLAAGETSAISHRSAAQLWGLGSFDDIVELCVRYERAPVIPGAVVHRSLDLLESDSVWLDGLWVTSVPRTLVDAAAVVSVPVVELLMDRALGRGLTTPAEVRAMLERVAKRGRRGAGRLRKVLDERSLGDQLTDSEIEEILARACRKVGIPAPTPQVPVTVFGRNYRLDFAYEAAKVGFEAHGFADHARRPVWENDHQRRSLLQAAGWEVHEFTRRQLLRDRAHIRTVMRSLIPRLEQANITTPSGSLKRDAR